MAMLFTAYFSESGVPKGGLTVTFDIWDADGNTLEVDGVEVPLQVIKSISTGLKVEIETGGAVINGKVFAIIPKGNISTRTFPVKIRVRNTMSLIEGMEAIVSLPVSHKEESLMVHRDAIITVYGKTVIYTVNDMKASSVPVKVTGYSGMTAGIYAEGLKEGMKVVVKGNERLRPGQTVIIKE